MLETMMVHFVDTSLAFTAMMDSINFLSATFVTLDRVRIDVLWIIAI